MAVLKEFWSVAKITQISATKHVIARQGHPLARRSRKQFEAGPYQSKELGALVRKAAAEHSAFEEHD